MHYISDWSELLPTKQIISFLRFFNQIPWPSAILVPWQIIFRWKYNFFNFRSLSSFVITKLISERAFFEITLTSVLS